MTEKEIMDEVKNNVSNLEDSIITGFDVEDFFMSDRQCVKKLISLRIPELTDEDLNLVVFGRNIAEELGSSYKAFVSENQFLRKKSDDDEDDEDENDNDEEKRRKREKREKKKKEEKERTPKEKKKREKRKKDEVVVKDEDSPFKPLRDNDKLFEEIEKLKSELRKCAYLLQEKAKDLAFEVGTTTTLIVNSIPGMIAMIAPTTFNVPGAISLLMLALNNLKNLQGKVKEIPPLLDPFVKSNVIIAPDKMSGVTNFVNTTTGTLAGLSKTINALQIISQSKIDTLDKAQAQMEETKKQLSSLRPEQFNNTLDFEAKKKELELKKEAISKQAEQALKA